MRSALWFAFAAAIVAADRVTKLIVLQAFAPGETFAVTGFFNLVLVFNKGAAFSFLAGAPGWQAPLFAAIALAAAAFISVLLVRHPRRRLFCAGLALILGGALGNLWDRLEWGQVVDFLDFHAVGWHWPAFNVADSAITVGAGLLIGESFLQRDAGA
ncbi:MAG: signal peptidase II [Betaproteobacteria bacterium RIFCSPLOWO2_12_FULL_67_28]|nr:MAG: signal peptidase II [Betaproteobacteria bacterium RIFCSPLOWO2_02_FULL_68_150]OGA57240.1 MAG: signal peptidase II [Betaproteobacteria bacterium RIFCSPLOWO2_12_FULL_67_28]